MTVDNTKDIEKKVADIQESEASKSTLKKITNSYDDFDFETAEHLNQADADVAKAIRRGGRKQILSFKVIHHENGSNRIEFSELLYEELKLKGKVQALINGSDLILGAVIPNATMTFKFPIGEGKTNLYKGGLHHILRKKFNLNFENGKSTNSFYGITIHTKKYKGQDIIFAVVDMSKPSQG